MRTRRWIAALLALGLLLALIPAATTEALDVELAGETPEEVGDAFEGELLEAGEAEEAPAEVDGGRALDALELTEDDLPELEAELPEAGDGGARANAESLVRITRPVDGSVVTVGDVEVWLSWTFPGGDAKEIAAKLFPTIVQLVRGTDVLETKMIQPPVTAVFTEDGAHYLDFSLPGPGTYSLRATAPGSAGEFSVVTFEAIGEEVTPTPKPSPTPKPTPEPVITEDENGFGVDQTGVLRSYSGSKTKIVIPESVNAIGEDVFKGRTVASVTTHGGVKRILSFAFSECGPLDTVKLATGLVSIGEGAFYASEIKHLTIPEGVRTIDHGAFHQCRSLENISFPASLESLGTYMFGFSEKLETVTFAKDCKIDTLGTDTFYSCTALKSVNIPESVTTLGQYAFAECKSLEHLELPPNLTTIMCYAFQNCSSLKELAIPGTVISIGDDVFDGCTALTLVVVEGTYAEQYARQQGLRYRIAAPEPTPAPKVKLSKCKVTVKDQVYTGKALKPKVTVKYGKKTLKKGTDYTVTYKSNKAVGTATVVVKGKGGYTGSKKATFAILPRGTALSTLTPGKKTATVTWEKQSGVTGYQLQYGLKKSMTGAVTVTVKKAGTTSRVLKKLKSGKKYYVRVRTYKTVNKKKYYSSWSKIKAVKVK